MTDITKEQFLKKVETEVAKLTPKEIATVLDRFLETALTAAALMGRKLENDRCVKILNNNIEHFSKDGYYVGPRFSEAQTQGYAYARYLQETFK